MEKRLAEIQARFSEIVKELDGEVTEERMAELETEQRNLETEKAMIERKMNLRGKLSPMEDGGKAEDGPEVDEALERAKKIQAEGRMTIAAVEVRNLLASERATTLATDTLVKPTGAGNIIRDNMETVSSIVDQVYSQDLTGLGAYEEAYVKAETEAGTRTDGVANTSPSDPVFRSAKLTPVLVNVTTYVSKNIKRLSPLNYEAKVKSMAIKALKRKAADYIANGDGTNFFGIKTAKNTKNETIYKELVVNTNAIGANTLKDIVFSYGGNDELGPNARLYLTKEDLAAFGAVRGTNEKKAIYEITADPSNANIGTIKEGGTIVPYTLMSGLTSLSKATQGSKAIQTMLYGDPKNFELGLFGDYTVEVSQDYKFAEGLLTIMGEVMLGGNLIVDEGFVVVTLAAKA